jgi:putative nucleotidyltransferase with HDIG domain
MTDSSLPRAGSSSGSLPSASASGSSSSGSLRPPRDRLADVVRPRPRVGLATGIAIAFGFALVCSLAVTAESWLGASIEPGRKASITVRVPPFAGADDGPRGGGVVIARGDEEGLARAAEAQAVLERKPPLGSTLPAHLAILFAFAAIYVHHCRRSNRGRLLRVQLVNLGVLAAAVVGVKALMLLTPLSVLIVPVALAAIVPTVVFDRTVGLATGVLAAIVMSLVVPFDLGVATILLAQAAIAGLIVPDRERSRVSAAMLGAVAGTIGAAVAYGIYLYLTTGVAPWAELARPLASPWIAAVLGGAVTLVLVVPAIPLYQLAVGEITHAKLVELEDLAHPMLRQIATKAPGTWQHSLAMANMAELAANAIGANGRLVRVGAYFHDLGKSLQPKYFIENLESGEVSPHEKLPPEVSCDAIFAHVTEGLTVARRAKLPERIVDFMHMHHGNGVLEYFWARCQDQGNPNHRTVEDFRYPGVPPQSRETAILAICDAVEAASRTLKRADEQTIGSLVQRIVYGKLHLGQLDDSGLSMADLRRISDSLRETIKHAHHGRIEYPWQKAEAAEAAAASGAPTVPIAGVGTGPGATPETTTQRLMKEPRLDSLDAPRPMWQRAATESTPPAPAPAAIGVATTAVMSKSGSGTAAAAAPAEPVAAATLPGPHGATPAAAVPHAVGTDPALITVRGREAAPRGAIPRGSTPAPPAEPVGSPPPATRVRSSQPRVPPPMTPSEAAISVAPTFPPDPDTAPRARPSQPPAPAPTPRPAITIEADDPTPLPPPDPGDVTNPGDAHRPSAAAIATPSRVMAQVTSPSVVGMAPTTLPGVTTDRLTPPPLEVRITAPRSSQPHPEVGDVARAEAMFDDPSASRPTRGGTDPRTTPPPPPGAKRDLDVPHFPPPSDEDSQSVIAARPRPADDLTTSPAIAARPKRQRQPALIVDDAAPPRPPSADAESASTVPRMAAFRPGLPLPANPDADTDEAEVRPGGPRRKRPTSQWSQGLANRVDRAFEDEVANSTPVQSPSPAAIASLAGNPEITKLTPLHEIEQLARASISGDTEDVPLFDGWDRDRDGRTEPHTAVDADGNPLPGNPNSNPAIAVARTRTIPPPAPGSEARARRSTEEVDVDAIEASIEQVPRVATRSDGSIGGPPPSTRPTTGPFKRPKPD